MPTTKKRINLTVDDNLWKELQRLKALRGVSSLAALVLELTKEALELQEDLYFAKIAEERAGEATMTHEQMWEEV